MGASSNFKKAKQMMDPSNRTVYCVGYKGTGKSLITKFLISRYPQSFSPDKFMSLHGFRVGSFHISYFDSDRFDINNRALWRKLFTGASGIIFVTDVSNAGNFERTKLTVQGLLEANKTLRYLPLLIYANKRDLVPKLSDQDIVQQFGLDRERLCKVFPSCAITGEGINEGFSWLIETFSS